MPVVMVKVDAETLKEQPSWQLDLNKIYAENTAEAFVNLSLSQPNHWFAGALFNDHLLGAVLVNEKTDCWQLSELDVRKVTRRRGVAKRLMELLIAQAKEKGTGLSLPDLKNHEAAQALAIQLGFTPANVTHQGWVLK